MLQQTKRKSGFRSKYLRTATAILFISSISLAVQSWAADDQVIEFDEVTVSGERPAVDRNLPAVTEGITAKEIAESVNVINTEDALKYLPSIHVRKRYIGDRNSVVATRTSGTQLSARALVYTDGMLLSNLLGNRYSFAPRWNMVSPEEVDRIDVIYGPFSAAHPGNSMGATILMTTRMPEKFESHVKAQSFWQNYENYGTDEDYKGSQFSVSLGDRRDRLAWFAGMNHIDSEGHPQGFATSALSSTAVSGGETAVTGAHRDNDHLGNSRVIFGATSIDDSEQDNFKGKVAYDISPTMQLKYTLGLWQNDSDVTVQSYLRDGAGNPVYSGNIDIDGYRYNLSSSKFRPSKREEEHWMNGLSLKTDTGREWDFEATTTHYDYDKDETRSPSTALPTAQSGGAGTIALSDGTGWRNLDLKADWRPGLDNGRHEASFGYHSDRYILESRVMNTDNWLSGGPTTLKSAFYGKTETQALFLQDAWSFRPDWKLTLGGRYEVWEAFDGSTTSTTTTINHARRKEHFFSPKASVSFQTPADWLLRASLGRAVRMPTVNEMFQGSVSAGAIVNNDPNLKPERAWSSELTAEREAGKGILRLSIFHEDASQVLYQQTDITVDPTITNFQNIGKVRTRGAEVAFNGKDVGMQGLDFNGNVTYTDSEIMENEKYPASIGKKMPRIPEWRASAALTWHQSYKLNYTLGARYSGRQYNTQDNIDTNSRTYGGTSKYFMVDVKANYKIAKKLTASLGVDNLNNNKAYVYHPYPQRVFNAQVKYDF